jgi:lipopolysaccharide biosynthesis glycosyltransferase
MLLNLSKMRKDNTSEKLVELKAKGTYRDFMDQDEINAVIGTHVVYVSPAYNLMERNFNHSLAKTASFYSAECTNFHNVLNAPVLRHLTNSPKVWCNPKDDNFEVWLDFLPPTLFKDYVRFLDGQMDRRINQVELKVQSAQNQAQQLAHQLEQTQAGEQQAKAQLQQALEVVQSAQNQAQQLAHQLEQTQAGEQQALTELEIVKKDLHLVHQANHNHWLQLEQARQELHQVHQSNHQHWLLAQHRLQEINALRNSKSWRITAPLRWPMNQLRLLGQYGFKARLKSLIKKILSRVLPFIATRPKLKAWAVRLAYRLGVAEQIKPFAQTILQSRLSEVPTLSAGNSQEYQLIDEINLTPRARQIYNDLKLAIAQQHKRVH